MSSSSSLPAARAQITFRNSPAFQRLLDMCPEHLFSIDDREMRDLSEHL